MPWRVLEWSYPACVRDKEWAHASFQHIQGAPIDPSVGIPGVSTSTSVNGDGGCVSRRAVVSDGDSLTQNATAQLVIRTSEYVEQGQPVLLTTAFSPYPPQWSADEEGDGVFSGVFSWLPSQGASIVSINCSVPEVSDGAVHVTSQERTKIVTTGHSANGTMPPANNTTVSNTSMGNAAIQSGLSFSELFVERTP